MVKKADDPMNKIHATKNVYQCPRCGKRFEYMTQAQNHSRIHNGEIDLELFEVVPRE